MYICIYRPAARGGGSERGRPPVLKDPLFCWLFSTNILNMVHLWNKINEIELIYHKVTSFIILKIEVSVRQPLNFQTRKKSKTWGKWPLLSERWLRACTIHHWKCSKCKCIVLWLINSDCYENDIVSILLTFFFGFQKLSNVSVVTGHNRRSSAVTERPRGASDFAKSRSLTVIENCTIWKLEYGLLFTFHSNYGRIFSRFDTIRNVTAS